MTLTKRQSEILEYIIDFAKRNLYQPSFKEVGDKFGITVCGVRDHLKAIEKKGVILLQPHGNRCITFLDERFWEK